MQCPTCADSTLVMSDRQGVEIDYCPKCRGVWLDRGELDKLIERSMNVPAPSQSPPVRAQPQFADSDYGHGHGYGSQGYRKKSWLKDIFD
ncbi:MAG: zf-TFIIB domain-containing protein [Pseudomonadota bacterium]